jgi:hypothetical protein
VKRLLQPAGNHRLWPFDETFAKFLGIPVELRQASNTEPRIVFGVLFAEVIEVTFGSLRLLVGSLEPFVANARVVRGEVSRMIRRPPK